MTIKRITRIIERHLFASLFFMIAILFLTKCTKKVYDFTFPDSMDGRYDTEFPYKDCAKQLEEIANTVKKINYQSYYTSYIFSYADHITSDSIPRIQLKKRARKIENYPRTDAGTATIIFRQNHRIALLTCAHIVDSPDTIISHFYIEGQPQEIIQSVSIKVKSQITVIDIPNGYGMKILQMDRKKDIAVIGKDYYICQKHIPVFSYPAGMVKKLDWGSFVYVIGFPIGNKMITRGIVSNPKIDASGAFLIDALFNRGFSGGLVLAIKDGVPNFEMVGIAKSVSAQSDYVLKPAIIQEQMEYNPLIPYRGKIYAHQNQDIHYGITYSISVDFIREFFKENEMTFNRMGFYFQDLFN